jgi:hypothetical protein
VLEGHLLQTSSLNIKAQVNFIVAHEYEMQKYYVVCSAAVDWDSNTAFALKLIISCPL